MNWDEYFMKMVYLVASKSKDPRTKVGAVIVNCDRQVLTTGYNGICRGVLDPADSEGVHEYRQLSPDKYFWYEHSERNSIYQAARVGVSLIGSTMYTQGIPCHDCGRAIIQAGIKKVVIHQCWPRNGLETSDRNDVWTHSMKITREMFHEAQIKIDVLDKTLNVQGYLDGKEVNV